MKNKFTKDIVPEGFSIAMALVDMLPVVFFGATGFVIGMIFANALIVAGALITFASGFIKVIWKLLVVVKKKNVWPLFIQMRIVMPVGLLIFLIGLIICLADYPVMAVWSALSGMPQLIFFIMGIVGMVAMIVFAAKLDSADAKSNWIEQVTNGIAQACFFIGTLIIFMGLQ